MTIGQVLAEQLNRTREWTLKLVSDIADGDWTYQLQPGYQHALWICGHLTCAQEHLFFQRCLNKSVLDPSFPVHFQIGQAVKSAEQYDWPTVAAVRQKMDDMQKITEETVAGLSADLLAEPAYGKDGVAHPHYDTKLGAISHLSRHEAFHAGQLATIRRMLGKPFLR